MVRTAAIELQKADAGRKYARKDKRPLDPPPVVQVRFFEVFGVGQPNQYEQELTLYDDAQMPGFVCQVDLFPVADAVGSNTDGKDPAMPILDPSMDPMASPVSPRPSTSSLPQPLDSDTARSSTTTDNFGLTAYRFPPLRIENFPVMQFGPSSQMSPDSDIIAYYGRQPIKEASNSTRLLAGGRVADAVTFEYNDMRLLGFVFNDLAVKQAGFFTLRYRIFNIFAKAVEREGLTIPILASCFGGVFRIWPSKLFPGLAPSTALTKRLFHFGASVNVRRARSREKSRKKQKVGQPDTQETMSSPGSQMSFEAG